MSQFYVCDPYYMDCVPVDETKPIISPVLVPESTGNSGGTSLLLWGLVPALDMATGYL